MSPPPKDYKVGYKRPPKETRWKKGQSGNPARQRPAQVLSALESIDKHLLRPIKVVENGQTRRVTTLEVILRQLLQQELEGSRRALSVRLKYEAIAQESHEQGLELQFAESDYMQALVGSMPSEGTGNE
jgi:hypothetical protein